MAEMNAAKFIREVRQEAVRVTWPARKETLLSTSMVLFLVAISAIFFYVVDSLIAWGVRLILGLSS